MSFLAPLFLLGALAAALPIVLHLIRRTTREVTPFSSLRFLSPTPPRVTQRSRLENIWLLILRCLALALLALAFARPFFRGAQPIESAAQSKATVVLVDVSASMQRPGLWDAAQARAAAILEAVPADEFAAMAIYDRTPRVILSFADWHGAGSGAQQRLARERLQGARPGWQGTQLAEALKTAAELAPPEEISRFTARRIVVISDLQEGSRLDGLAGYRWPEGAEVALERVGPAQAAANASFRWEPAATGFGTPEEAAQIRLRVENSAESDREEFTIRAAGREATRAYVPKGQRRMLRLAAPAPPQNGETFELEGDAVAFDNRVFVAPRTAVRIAVLYAGAASSDPKQRDEQLFFLQRALQSTPDRQIEVIAPGAEQAFRAEDIARANLLIIGENAAEEPTARAAATLLAAGKPVLMTTHGPQSERLLKAVAGSDTPAPQPVEGREFALLGRIDFTHPVFSGFSDPRFSDFSKIRFWRHWRLAFAGATAETVLARFDSGEPALIELKRGAGAVYLLTSSWKVEDSQLALSTKFVPLLFAIMEQGGDATAPPLQYFTGDSIPLPGDATGVRMPDGAVEPRPPGAAFDRTEQPGLYYIEGSARWLAVNLPPEESRLAPLGPEAFTALQVPLRAAPAAAASAESPSQAAALAAGVLEQRQKIWRWLVVALGLVLLAETWLAGRRRTAAAV